MTRWVRPGLAIAGSVALVAGAVAIGSAVRERDEPPGPIRLEGVTVYSLVHLGGLVVEAESPHRPKRRPKPRGRYERAREGVPVSVEVTAYCLSGTTRRGRYVRSGIVAADPRIFPLSRYIELFVDDEYVGRFLVDDTGRKIKGRHLDIWKPTCDEAVQFGHRRGAAVLVARRRK